MNRAPSKNDTWWSQHQSRCTGTFEKVAEPESYKAKQQNTSNSKSSTQKLAIKSEASSSLSKSSTTKSMSSSQKTLDKFFNLTTISHSLTTRECGETQPELDKFLSIKRKQTDSSQTELSEINANSLPLVVSTKKKKIIELIQLDDKEEDDDDVIEVIPTTIAASHKTNKDDKLIACPVCFKKIGSNLINSHVNSHFQE